MVYLKYIKIEANQNKARINDLIMTMYDYENNTVILPIGFNLKLLRIPMNLRIFPKAPRQREINDELINTHKTHPCADKMLKYDVSTPNSKLQQYQGKKI